MSNLKLPTMTIARLRKFKHGATIAYATIIVNDYPDYMGIGPIITDESLYAGIH